MILSPERVEARRAANREAQRRYRAAHPERVRACGQRYREANRERELERYRRYREENRERRREANREHCRRYYAANRGRLLEAKRRRYEANPEQIRERVRRWNEDHPGRHRARSLQRNYGITAEQYDAMLQAQGGVCAICGQPETARMSGKTLRLAVDHDHATGRVRGLLCATCNRFIGGARHDLEVLRSAIAYLAYATAPVTTRTS